MVTNEAGHLNLTSDKISLVRINNIDLINCVEKVTYFFKYFKKLSFFEFNPKCLLKSSLFKFNSRLKRISSDNKCFANTSTVAHGIEIVYKPDFIWLEIRNK